MCTTCADAVDAHDHISTCLLVGRTHWSMQLSSPISPSALLTTASYALVLITQTCSIHDQTIFVQLVNSSHMCTNNWPESGPPLDFDCRLLTASAFPSILSGGSKIHGDSELSN